MGRHLELSCMFVRYIYNTYVDAKRYDWGRLYSRSATGRSYTGVLLLGLAPWIYSTGAGGGSAVYVPTWKSPPVSAFTIHCPLFLLLLVFFELCVLQICVLQDTRVLLLLYCTYFTCSLGATGAAPRTLEAKHACSRQNTTNGGCPR